MLIKNKYSASIYISQAADKTKQRVPLNLENDFNYFYQCRFIKSFTVTLDILGPGSYTAVLCSVSIYKTINFK